MTVCDADRLFTCYAESESPDDFGAFYDASIDEVLTQARRWAPDEESAEDLVQRTYLAAFEGFSRFNPKQRAMPWLQGILQNQARIQRWRSRRKFDGQRLTLCEPRDPAMQAEDSEFTTLLDQAFDQIGPVYKPVMILHLQHGLSAKEIGAVLQRPAGTVRTQVVRGMSMLRKLLPASVASGLVIQSTPAQSIDGIRRTLCDRVHTGSFVAGSVISAQKLIVALGIVGVAAVGYGIATELTGESPPATPLVDTLYASREGDRSGSGKSKPSVRFAVVPQVGTPSEQDPEADQGRAAITRKRLFSSQHEYHGVGGAWGGRDSGRKRLVTRGRAPVADAIDAALAWIVTHQSPDGRWDADGFTAMDDPKLGPAAGGLGSPGSDVAVTALALLALTNDGKHAWSPKYGDAVQRGTVWLLRQQDAEGSFTRAAPRSILHHAIATLALTDVVGIGRVQELAPYALKAVRFLEQKQGPEGCWRDQDRGEDLTAETTAWAVLTMFGASAFKIIPGDAAGRPKHSAQALGLEPRSARDHAARLLARFFHHGNKDDITKADTATCLRANLEWEASNDLTLWLMGSRGLYQVGGKPWKDWSRSLLHKIVAEQREDGNFKGSWNPDAMWGQQGGRIYATAMLTLTLETNYAYTALIR